MRATHTQVGYSLLQVMIALSIVGIVIAFALPSYRQTVLKSYRKDMLGQMMELAAAQEQLRTLNGSYSAVASTNSKNGRYNYTVTLPAGRDYLITATATGDQANDSGCTSLSLDGLGNRTPISCWTK